MFKTILGIELTSDGYVIDDAYIIQLLKLLTYGLTQTELPYTRSPNTAASFCLAARALNWRSENLLSLALGQPCYASNMPYPHKPFFHVTA